MFIKSPVSPETFFITEGKQENEERKLEQANSRVFDLIWDLIC